MRGSEWEREWKSECEWNTPLSQPLFKGERVKAHKERPATTVREPLVNVGPRSRWPWVGRLVGSAGPRVGLLVPPFSLVLPQWLSSLKIWCTAKSLLEKMSKLFFPKDFKTQKIFLVFFCKNGKVLEKIPACRKQLWKFQTCSGEKQIRCKENVEKRKTNMR